MVAPARSPPHRLRADLADRSIAIRARALSTLLDDGKAAARHVPEVSDRIRDPDPGLRLIAATVLSKTGRPGVEGLIRGLSPRQPTDVRVRSAAGLAEVGPEAEAAVDALGACLFAKEEPLRWQASWALGEIGEPSVEPVLRILRATEDPLVRVAACDALGFVGPPGKPAVKDLKRLTGSDLPSVRMAAGSALVRVTDGKRKHVAPLIKQTKDEDPEVRREALVRIGQQQSNGHCAHKRCRDLLGDPEAAVRAEAAYTLARIEADPAKYVEPLIPLLRDGSPEVRRAAGAALHAFGPAAGSALPELEARFEDPDPGVRSIAHRAVKKIGGE